MATVVGRDSFAVRQGIRGVCFIAPELDRIGGYELQTLTLARRLRQRGVPVSVVTTTKESVNRTCDDDLIRIENRGRLGILLLFPRLFWILQRKRADYGIIHCSTFSYLSGLAVLAARSLCRPILLRVATENDVRKFADGRDWKHRLFSWLLHGASGVIAPSRAICEELLGAGFAENKIFLTPNGVDIGRFRPAIVSERRAAKHALQLTEEIMVVGTVARLERRKGIDILLQAFGTLRDKYRIHLLIIGDGPMRDELHDLADSLKISGSISWVGFQAEPENWLRAMDLFVFPSRLEGSPNAVIEAMASGLPIIATKIGGVVDLIEDEVTGILAAPDDPDVLALALERMIEDASLRVHVGSQARIRAVQSFSIEEVVSHLLELYSDIAGAC